MYCINCGVELADSEKRCPLCHLEAYHPKLPRPEGRPLYPPVSDPAPRWNPLGVQLIVTLLFALTATLCLLGDIRMHGGVRWSGYVAGALAVCYTAFVLPGWFRRPNPVIFTPAAFTAVLLYLLYIDLFTAGQWFLSFAFPVAGVLALLCTTLAALLRYVRRGYLYIFGGFFILLGLHFLLMEGLLCFTFPSVAFAGWSFYPLIALCLLGLFLILTAICHPLRESLARRFFL